MWECFKLPPKFLDFIIYNLMREFHTAIKKENSSSNHSYLAEKTLWEQLYTIHSVFSLFFFLSGIFMHSICILLSPYQILVGTKMNQNYNFQEADNHADNQTLRNNYNIVLYIQRCSVKGNMLVQKEMQPSCR